MTVNAEAPFATRAAPQQNERRDSEIQLTIAKPHPLHYVLSFGIALLVLSVAVAYRHQLIAAVSKISIPWVVAGLCFYWLNYALRALRLSLIAHRQIRWWPEALFASSAHGLATYIIPFRAGELTLPVLLRSVSELELMQGSRILVRARLLDAQTLGLWILIAAAVSDIPVATALRVAWGAAGLLLLALPRVIAYARASRPFMQIGLMRKVASLFDEEIALRTTFLFSIGIWSAIAGAYFCAARAIGLALSPMQVWLLISIQLPLQLLPVQGVAGTGAHEGGWLAALLLLGISMPEAIEFALTSHVVILVYVLSLGPLAIIFGRFCKREGNIRSALRRNSRADHRGRP